MKNIMKRHCFLKACIILILFLYFTIADLSSLRNRDLFAYSLDEVNLLYAGRKSFENKDYDNAIYFLTKSLEKFPLLSDYILYWRAEAYEKKGELKLAIDDLRILRENFKDFPYIKNVRKKEVQLSLTLEEMISSVLLRKYISDYPEDMEMRFLYAKRLKTQGEIKEAKRVFKEVFLSNSSYSNLAREELSIGDINPEDLLKKGENLSKAFYHKEAEKFFREALNRKDSRNIKEDLLKGLANSLFKQKKYSESVELYKKIKDNYWYARSLLRSGDIKTFESELPMLKRSSDPKIGKVLISYGNRMRRNGDIVTALKIFKDVLNRYPSLKEESLWAIGWTYHMNRDFEKAYEIFSQLYDTFKDSKYAYWQLRAYELSSKGEPSKRYIKADLDSRNFYSLLMVLKEGRVINGIEKRVSPSNLANSLTMMRVDILKRIGSKKEAIQELIHYSKRTNDLNTKLLISSKLKDLEGFKFSMNIMSRIPYREDFHELFYPFAYWEVIQNLSMKYDIDPYIVVAIMREESRFDEEAKSIAGAIGLMQLMPQTASRLKSELRLGTNSLNLYDPNLNILLGIYYFKKLMSEFKYLPIAVAAYNAGEHAVREWLRNSNYKTIDEFIEDIPYDETRNYVMRVLVSYVQYYRFNAKFVNSSSLRDTIMPVIDFSQAKFAGRM